MVRAIQIGLSAEHYELLSGVQNKLEEIVELIDQANELQRESNEFNFTAKRYMLEIARELRKVAGSAALHVADKAEDDG